MTRLTAKSSTIFIATGDSTQVFQSMQDVPPALRKRLQQSTSGANSATILIADRGGRQELARAMGGRSVDVQSRLADTLRAREEQARKQAPKRVALSVRTWVELMLPAAIGGALWLLVSSRK